MLWIIGSIIVLVLLVFVLIEVPAVQNFARKKVVSFLEGKIKTKVEIDRLSLDLPKLLVLEGVYFEDQKRDTLLAADTLKVDISLLKILDSEIEINEIDLRGIRANIQRTLPDSAFNFDYIISAFVGEQKKEPVPQDTSAGMKFSVGKINLDRINITFKDAVTANDVAFYLGHFDTRITEFNLDSMRFAIPKINLSGVNAKIIQGIPATGSSTVSAPIANTMEADTAASPGLKLKLGTINLSKIKVKYVSEATKNDIDLYLGQLYTRITEINLDSMRFGVPEVQLANVNARIIQGKPAAQTTPVVAPADAATEEPLDVDVQLGTIGLNDIKVKYQNDVSALKSDVNLGKLLAEVDNIDMKNQRVSIKNVQLNDTRSVIVLGKTVQAKVIEKEVEKVADSAAEANWRVKVANIELANNNLKFDDFNQPVQKLGLDYGHMGITALNFNAKDFYYSLDTISGNIGNISFRDKSGFVLNEFRTNFLYGPTGAYLKELYVETPQTILRNSISVGYPSLESISKNPGAMSINANLVNCRLGLKDVLAFMPDLASNGQLKLNSNAVFRINTKISGKVADLTIPNFEVAGLGGTRIRASARMTGLPDMDKARFNVRLNEFRSGSADINRLVSVGTIPSNIRVPASFNLTGTFKGGLTDFNTNLFLNTSYGSARAIAAMNSGRKKGAEKFNANVQINNFHVGRLIKQDTTVGRVTLTAKVAGVGTDPKYMRANFSAALKSAYLMKYDYRNLEMSGTFANQTLTAKADMDDENIDFDLDAVANISGEFPAVKLDLNVDSANMRALKLYNEELRFKGKIAADMPSTNPDSLVGTIDASNLQVVSNGKLYQLDTLNIAAKAKGDQKDLRIRTELVSANLTGKYTLTEVGSALTNEINKYFKIGDGKPLPVKTVQDFTFAFNVTNRPILQEFVPELTKLEPVNFKGSYNSQTGSLVVDGSVKQVVYSGNTINNLRLQLNTADSALNYALNLNGVSTASLQLNKTSLNGNIQNNQLGINLNLKDKTDKDKYSLAGLFSVLDTQYQFSFNEGGLLLDYEPWTVAADNALQFGPGGILARNFVLSKSGQSLGINSEPQQLNAPLNVTFADFKIATLTAMAEKDSILADGTINGKVVLSNLDTSPVFVSDLLVKNFTFRADTVGDISIKVNNSRPDTYAAQVNITNNGNDVLLDGEYFVKPNDSSSFDFDLAIKNINLASIEGLTMGSLKQMSGNITGDLNITGTPASPSVRGGVNFNKAAFNVALLNAYYRIDNEQISFTNQGIEFDTFTLVDSIGNNAVVDGAVYTTNFTDFRFGLDINTDNFRVLSSTEKDNDLFYGTVFLNSDLRIRGDMNSPIVDGSLRINDKTDFTIVLPQNDPGLVEREGVVVFVNMDNIELLAATDSTDSLNSSDITGLDVSLNIETDSNAVFNVIVDKGNGDFLRVKGDAQLSAGIDPSGKINMTGTYQIVEGAYELSFNFLQRRFEMQKGSTITWTGEPTSATVDLTAIYVAETAPINLVEGQLDLPPAGLNRYKQELPFQVFLNMDGELLKPEITFGIGLPEDQNFGVARDVLDNVEARLTQLESEPSELNKQVFALLLLNRFVAENPFASSSGGGGIESAVRNSVSEMLSDQLNNLAGNLIEGVDLNFDLVSSDDYTTGELQNRTDLNVGLSKQLLNDRLKVSIGSNFELEGPSNANQSSNNIAGNVAFDYQLSKDGRYMLRGYRKNVTDAIVDGYIIETGVGFIITLDYTKFREIFARKAEEDKKLRRDEKINRKQEKEENKTSYNIEN